MGCLYSVDGNQISEDAVTPTNWLDLTLCHTQNTTTHTKQPLSPTFITSSIMLSICSPAENKELLRSGRRPTDLRRDAVRLCIALQSQKSPVFLGAATELLACLATLSSQEFCTQSRTIIRLIEVARKNLEDSGISLHLFTASCQQGLRWKDVYFSLLRMLQKRRADIDETLEARVNRLLIRLSPHFVDGKSPVASYAWTAATCLPESVRESLANGITTCTPQPGGPSSSGPSITMPPPAVSVKRNRPKATPESANQEPCRKREKREQKAEDLDPERPDSEEENDESDRPDFDLGLSWTAYAYKSPPLKKRFGIWCTGKTSMNLQKLHAVQSQ
ncbi:hypothetical protein R3P38DRAFT_3253532 [Favolaschia claudopus]|uniref:Uncharacterized protein n=1 Tax=Favolaschia claudopus TaxID=2862362 RepID=A0AAW0DUN0_9AGAR